MTFRTDEQILTSFKARFGIAHTAISNRDWFAEIFGASQPLYGSEIWLQFPVGEHYYANHDGTVILDGDVRRVRTWNGSSWVSVASGNSIPVEKVVFPLSELLSTNAQAHMSLLIPQATVNPSEVTPSLRMKDFINFADYGSDFLPRIYWDNGSGTGPGAEITTVSLPNSWIWDAHSGILLCGADVTDQFVPTDNLPIWIQHYKYVGTKGIEDAGTSEVACLSSDGVGEWMCVRGERVNGKYRVQRVDPQDQSKMPGIGILISKSTPTVGVVQRRGICDILTGLDWTKPVHWIDNNGLTSATKPTAGGGGGYAISQSVGRAVASDRFLISGSLTMYKSRA